MVIFEARALANPATPSPSLSIPTLLQHAHHNFSHISFFGQLFITLSLNSHLIVQAAERLVVFVKSFKHFLVSEDCAQCFVLTLETKADHTVPLLVDERTEVHVQ